MRKGASVLVAVVFFCVGISVSSMLGQTLKRQPRPLTAEEAQKTATDGVLVFGENLGLRIQGKHGQRVTGMLVARVDGKWVEVQLDSYNALAGH